MFGRRVRRVAVAAGTMIALTAVIAHAHYVSGITAYCGWVSHTNYPTYTLIHTSHAWNVVNTVHSVDIDSWYFCFVDGNGYQESGVIEDDDLGPGSIWGGGDMYSIGGLDGGWYYGHGNTVVIADGASDSKNSSSVPFYVY